MTVEEPIYEPGDLSVAISDVAFEQPGVSHVTVVSPALRGRGDMTVFVPDAASALDAPPVVILLHGVFASHWCWLGLAGADRTLNELIEREQMTPFILAMPSDGLWGEGTAYLNMRHARYEDWITEDVPRALTLTLPQVTDKTRLYLGGMSMGGFGALRLGAKRGDRFRGFSAHSRVTHARQLADIVKRHEVFETWPERCIVFVLQACATPCVPATTFVRPSISAVHFLTFSAKA